MKKVWTRIEKSRAWHSLRLFLESGGNLSAAGMSFQGLFAVFAAVWIGFQILSLTVGTAPKLREAVIYVVNLQIPGLIQAGGPIDPEQLTQISGWGWSGLIAAVLLVFTAVAWLDYTRIAIRRIFGLATPRVNVVLLKTYDFVIALGFGVVITASAAGSLLITGFIDDVTTWLNLDHSAPIRTFMVQSLGIFILFGFDVVILAGMIALLSGIPIPARRLFAGATLGALALDVLKIVAGIALENTGHNPLLASFAIFVGLLIWFNLACRVYLLTAAWIASGLERDGIAVHDVGWVIPGRGSRPSRTSRA